MDATPAVPAPDLAMARGTFRSTKTYDHNEGLSCTFRQWRAGASHCSLLHGYALAFRFVFVARELDERGWCLDFGGLKPVRAWLHEMFDHTLLVAADDPERVRLEALGHHGLADVRVVPAVGCEATARLVHARVSGIARDLRVCECIELVPECPLKTLTKISSFSTRRAFIHKLSARAGCGWKASRSASTAAIPRSTRGNDPAGSRHATPIA